MPCHAYASQSPVAPSAAASFQPVGPVRLRYPHQLLPSSHFMRKKKEALGSSLGFKFRSSFFKCLVVQSRCAALLDLPYPATLVSVLLPFLAPAMV